MKLILKVIEGEALLQEGAQEDKGTHSIQSFRFEDSGRKCGVRGATYDDTKLHVWFSWVGKVDEEATQKVNPGTGGPHGGTTWRVSLTPCPATLYFEVLASCALF